jgi:hypothetical protein
MRKYIVFEYNKNAGSQYKGTRYMTSDEGQPIVEGGDTNVVARGLDEKDAYALLNVTVEKNIQAYLNEVPDELRNPESDAFIANLIRRHIT